jgi:excisionase family DNA binding protein
VINQKEVLSVSEAAALCGVGRGTVGYWIRSKKLQGDRVGRKYSIPVEDLLYFLRSNGQRVPSELLKGNVRSALFRKARNCWQYWQGTSHGKSCEECMVFKNRLDVCFVAKDSKVSHCVRACDECHFYMQFYLPRIQFIYQIDLPAAVYKDFYIWGGNGHFAQLCEIPEKDLIGMGIEHIVHADSLETVILNAKKRALGDPRVPKVYGVYLKNSQKGKLKVRVVVCPLREPSGAYFIFAEQELD